MIDSVPKASDKLDAIQTSGCGYSKSIDVLAVAPTAPTTPI